MLLPMIAWDAIEAIGTWVGGLGTAASLALGFSILRYDRKKDESSQARRITVWSLREEVIGSSVGTLTVSLWNRSDAPIFSPSLQAGWLAPAHVREVGGFIPFLRNIDQENGWMLPPDQRSEAVVKGVEPDISIWLWLVFRDAVGVVWYYNLRDQRLTTKLPRATVLRSYRLERASRKEIARWSK